MPSWKALLMRPSGLIERVEAQVLLEERGLIKVENVLK